MCAFIAPSIRRSHVTITVDRTTTTSPECLVFGPCTSPKAYALYDSAIVIMGYAAGGIIVL